MAKCSLFCTMKLFFLIIIFCWWTYSCGPKSKDSEIQKEEYLDPYLDAIRISASADKPTNKDHQAKIEFHENEYDFGTITEGDSVFHDFMFVNKGNARLLINDVSSSCGCTFPMWPKGFIRPNDSGKISIIFDSHEKVGWQLKTITVVANTSPTQTEVSIKGFVQKNKRN